MTLEREFQYSDKNFQFLKKKVKQFAGINLSDTKNELVYSRVSRLLRQYHLKTFDEYCDKLKQDDEQMIKEFVNAITTNYTTFMREPYHFDYLSHTILPHIKLNAKAKKLRIWSAGCSTGEEPYSISFIVNAIFGNDTDWDIKILATDVDSDALHKAKEAIYSQDIIKEVTNHYKLFLERYFDEATFDRRLFVVKEEYRKNIYFKLFNLMSKEWPMHGPFDIIFCRNVMIYFDRPTQEILIPKFVNLLSQKGYLILGPSEAFLQSQLPLKCVEGSIFRKES
ncbi:MAG: protein-glutamate O-methyltransferase CheR [Proteobacteria bacterium]|nr:protein-glutamate O-methyltransferase CheR [Pseudomonadota bacterium]